MTNRPIRTVDTEPLLRRMLLEAGVKSSQPNPAAAWEVFKRFVVVPVNCARDYLFFQAGDGSPEEGREGYFGFVREFECRGEKGDEPVWFSQVHISFTVPPPRRLGVNTITLYSLDFPSYAAFFSAVEQLPEFKRGLAFHGFVLSVFWTGV